MEPHGDTPLWSDRYLTDGRIVIPPRIRPNPRRPPYAAAPWWPQLRDQIVQLDWLAWIGREWSRQSRDTKWVIGVLIFLFTAGLGLLLPLAGVLVYRYRLDHPSQRTPPPAPAPAPLTPEAALASWDTTESRVAAAASRAWRETVHEAAWSSPLLVSSRAAFDGWAEVDQITGLALRIRNARLALGARPSGPAAEYWDRQYAALENTALQLGHRADALIRYRDQTAQLSAELQHLAELERLERTATEIDGLTIETAYASGRGDGGLGSVAHEIAGVRAAMTELVDLMTRTRAPLAQPPEQSGGGIR
jgi:hypothetical protein